MGAESAIEWTDATVNFWWGCTKVGPGCDHCYAETWAKRTGGGLWGVGAPRRKIKSAVALIHRLDNDYSWWAADHYIGQMHATPRRRVFIQSMSDLFDTEVPLEWFAEAWDKIERCDRLAIQIVTKRISVVEKRLAAIGATSWPSHAGLMISVVNQDEADRDVPRLLALKAKLGIPWVGLSMEPLLGPVNIEPWLAPDNTCQGCDDGDGFGNRCSSDRIPRDEQCPWNRAVQVVTEHGPFAEDGMPAAITCAVQTLSWVIVGGESGPGARPMHPAWARSLRDQCAAAGVPFMFKQWGEWAPMDAAQIVKDRPVADRWGNVRDWMHRYVVFADDAGAARVRGHSFTEHATDLVYRVGKKAAGRLLDGVQHDGLVA